MKTIYYLRLSVQRGIEPAVILDVEFGDMPALNAMLTEIHEADLAAYILIRSGEREVKFSHRMLGSELAAEFRIARSTAKASDSLKSFTKAATSMLDDLWADEEEESPQAYLGRAIKERERKIEQRMQIVTIIVITAATLTFIGAGLYLWKN